MFYSKEKRRYSLELIKITLILTFWINILSIPLHQYFHSSAFCVIFWGNNWSHILRITSYVFMFCHILPNVIYIIWPSKLRINCCWRFLVIKYFLFISFLFHSFFLCLFFPSHFPFINSKTTIRYIILAMLQKRHFFFFS